MAGIASVVTTSLMSQVKKEESLSLEGPKGHSLHEIKWSTPDLELKGLVYLCHGYDEHMEYYDEIGTKLAQNGYLAFGHDHPGHGKSSGTLLMSDSFESDYADNVIFNCELKVKEFGDKVPLYIIGHSMGGLVTCRVLIKRPELFKAAVLMAAALELSPGIITPLKMTGIKLINYVLPSCPVGKLTIADVTRDESRLEVINADPLRGRAFLKAGFAMAFMEEINSVQSRLAEIILPVLIQHGDEDKIIPLSASELIFNSISSTQKSKHIYPKAFHNLYHEIPEVRNEAIQEAVQWILDQ